jgi:hypothetical protein
MTEWDDAPVMFTRRLACPWWSAEGKGAWRSVRTDKSGGGKVRKYICNTCGGKFKISVEPPEIGNETFWPARMTT